MPIAIEDIIVRILGDTTQMNSSLGLVNQKAQIVNTTMTTIGNNIRQAFAAGYLVSYAKKFVEASNDFSAAMRNVNVIAKQSEAQFQETTDQVIALSWELGKSPTELATALYDITSAGFHGAEGLHILEVATRAAIGGFSEIKPIAKAVVSVLNAYQLSFKDAENITNSMLVTVDKGVLTFGELAENIGKIITTAAAAAVGFDEISGAAASLTKQGMQVDESFTSLNRLLLEFLKPTEKLTAAWIEQYGELPAVTLAYDGLEGSISKLNQVTNGAATTTAELGITARAIRSALGLTGDSMKVYTETMGAYKDETAKAERTTKAFEEAQKSNSRIAEEATAAYERAYIKLGDGINWVARQYSNLAKKYGEWATEQEKWGVERTFNEEQLLQLEKSRFERIQAQSEKQKEIAQDKITERQIDEELVKLSDLRNQAFEDSLTTQEQINNLKKLIISLEKSADENTRNNNKEILAYTKTLVRIEEYRASIRELEAKEDSDISKNKKDMIEDQKLAAAEQIAYLKAKKSLEEKINKLKFEELSDEEKLNKLRSEAAKIENQLNIYRTIGKEKTESYIDLQGKLVDNQKLSVELEKAINKEKEENIKKVNEQIEQLNKSTKALDINIVVPHLTNKQLGLLTQLFAVVAGVNANTVVDINFPKVSTVVFTAAVDFITKIAALKPIIGQKTVFNIDIQVPDFSSLRYNNAAGFLERIKDIPDKQIEIKLEFPEINKGDLNALIKFIEAMDESSFFSVEIPSNGLLFGDIDYAEFIGTMKKIASGLDGLSKLKGLIWA